MSESKGTGRIEKIFMRFALGAVVAGVGYLQTGQWSIQSSETARDTDSVAILKLVHRLELRLQRLEDRYHPEVGPLAVEVLPDEPIDDKVDLRKALSRLRSIVTKDEVETYQEGR